MDNTNTQQQQGDSSSNENEEINIGKVDSSESTPTDSGEINESAFTEEGTVTSNGDDEVTKLQLQVADLNDKYLRLYSEFDNYRRRTAKEKIDLSKTAGESFFNAILPVMDDFERGLKAMDEAKDIVALKEGVDLIFHKFKSTLVSKGLEPMLSVGFDFDADFHEAITSVPAPSEDLKGKVVDELEKGYLLNGKVIRFAKVIVGN